VNIRSGLIDLYFRYVVRDQVVMAALVNHAFGWVKRTTAYLTYSQLSASQGACNGPVHVMRGHAKQSLARVHEAH
jgi:hypothetical protein